MLFSETSALGWRSNRFVTPRVSRISDGSDSAGVSDNTDNKKEEDRDRTAQEGGGRVVEYVFIFLNLY